MGDRAPVMRPLKNPSLLPLLSHNPPDPTFGIPDIPGIPWDHMAMAVHHGLPGRFSNGNPNVVTGRRKILVLLTT